MAGGAFITWYDDRAAIGVDYDIYALRISVAGFLIGTPLGTLVSCGPLSGGTGQFMPRICSNNVGGAFIAYESWNAQTMTDIWMQEVDPNCIALWPVEIAVCNAMANQLIP
jgi:hypothetical protein